MKIIESKAQLDSLTDGAVLTIGNFDGMHLGHQEIIKTAKATSERRQAPLAVMTFDPHPTAILHPEKAPGVLTPLVFKKRLLEKYDVDYLIVIKDSYDFLNLSPAKFVDEFIMGAVRPSVVVEGVNFNFGYGRSGNIETLRQLAAEKGFEVEVVQAKKLSRANGRTVVISSSLVRDMLQAGQVADAAGALGRTYKLVGRVVKGRGKGKELGFPTANIEPLQQIIPAEGVYAGFVELSGSCREICKSNQKLPAAFSVGRAKTFVSGQKLLTEAHILDSDLGDLHGKWLGMDFIKRLRCQRRFDSGAELAEQIAKDCKQAKKILAAEAAEKKSEIKEQKAK